MPSHWMHLTLIDSFNRRRSLRREMQPHALLAEYVGEIQNFVTTLEAVTDLGVLRADFIQTSIQAAQSDPESGANVDVGATFVGYIDGGDGKKATTKIPGFKTSFVNSDGTVDVTATEVAAFLGNYADAGDFYISDGENVDEWIKGTLDR